MSTEDADSDNWLHASVFPCPHCGTQLFRVDHSPFSDFYHLYCDSCPNSVEVSYYDDACLQFDRDHGTDMPDQSALHIFVEAHLRPCDCGGAYRFDADRRCPTCHQPAIVSEPWTELSPSIMGAELEDRDPTPEEQVMYDRFYRTHVRTRDLWRRDDA